MIHSHEVLQIGDKLTVEVNWHESVIPCTKFRFIMEGKESIVERDDLYSMLMLFGDEKQQEDLIPVKETRVRAITRLLKIQAKKDIRKGETINFPYTYFMPSAIVERLLIQNPEQYREADLPTGQLEKHVNKL